MRIHADESLQADLSDPTNTDFDPSNDGHAKDPLIRVLVRSGIIAAFGRCKNILRSISQKERLR